MIMIDIAERSIAVFDHFIQILLHDEMQSSNDLLKIALFSLIKLHGNDPWVNLLQQNLVMLD